MPQQLDGLLRRVRVLTVAVGLLAAYCVAMTVYVVLARHAPVKVPEALSVHRLAIVDAKGTERVVLAAPLPDPIILGKRVKRDGGVSGILIFDPNGNERGGYVTSDDPDLGAFLSLDSDHDQVFTAYANRNSGATVWAANDKGDRVAFSTYQQPSFEIIQNKAVIFKNPSTAPDLR